MDWLLAGGSLTVLMGPSGSGKTTLLRSCSLLQRGCDCEMASAYAHVTGRVGLASVTHGPGVTQLMTALTTAARGDLSLVVFAGEAPTTATWTIQQIDQGPLIRACGVEYLQIQSVNHALDRVREAFCIAQHERRPVVVGVPDNVQRARLRGNAPYVPSSAFIPRFSADQPRSAGCGGNCAGHLSRAATDHSRWTRRDAVRREAGGSRNGRALRRAAGDDVTGERIIRG